VVEIAANDNERTLMGFLDKAKDLLAQNADKVDAAIDKAGEFVDSKTEGKYKDTVNKVQEAAKKALDDGAKDDPQN
jgi:hypothetical protein